jgi:hypothetical protein
MLCLLLDERRRREGKKKRESEMPWRWGDVPWERPTLLAVPQVAAVRYN